MIPRAVIERDRLPVLRERHSTCDPRGRVPFGLDQFDNTGGNQRLTIVDMQLVAVYQECHPLAVVRPRDLVALLASGCERYEASGMLARISDPQALTRPVVAPVPTYEGHSARPGRGRGDEVPCVLAPLKDDRGCGSERGGHEQGVNKRFHRAALTRG